jgi:rubrerythrin
MTEESQLESVAHYCFECDSCVWLDRNVKGERGSLVSTDPAMCPLCKARKAHPVTLGNLSSLFLRLQKRVKHLEEINYG